MRKLAIITASILMVGGLLFIVIFGWLYNNKDLSFYKNMTSGGLASLCIGFILFSIYLLPKSEERTEVPPMIENDPNVSI